MRDGDVRSALHAQLRVEHSDELKTTRILDELGLAGEVRVDVAVLNGSFSGYEIKSAKDTLRRLPKQVEMYSHVLDFAVLVVAENHYEHSLPLLPAWWGVQVATERGESVTLEWVRPAELNPTVSAFELSCMLWRDEVLGALTARGIDRGFRSKPRAVMSQHLSEHVEVTELRHLVREQLKARANWRVDAA